MGTQGDFNRPSLPPGGARGHRGGRSRAIRRERKGGSLLAHEGDAESGGKSPNQTDGFLKAL